jgi:CheY-like chemotaxis protein
MRVLVVEDEEDLAEMIADGLRSSGMVADVAFDGGRAMEMAAAADYDVLVLDRDLPGIHERSPHASSSRSAAPAGAAGHRCTEELVSRR